MLRSKADLRYEGSDDIDDDDVVRTDDWLSLTAAEVLELVSSDGLVAAELLVLDSVLRWWRHNSSGGGDGDQATLEQLLGRVRWPLCPPSVLHTLDTEDTYQEVRTSPAYRAFREGGTMETKSKTKR